MDCGRNVEFAGGYPTCGTEQLAARSVQHGVCNYLWFVVQSVVSILLRQVPGDPDDQVGRTGAGGGKDQRQEDGVRADYEATDASDEGPIAKPTTHY